MLLRSLLFLAVVAETLLASAFAGGSPADYDRALSLAKRTDNKLYRTGFEVKWSPAGDRLWYRERIGPGAAEYVSVDLATGKKMQGADPDTLSIEKQTMTTSVSGSLREHPSRFNRGETRIIFRNLLNETVSIFWLDLDGNRKPYGLIKPGEIADRATYFGHVWLIADAAGKTVAVFDARDETVELLIDGRPKEPEAEPARAKREDGISFDGQWSVQFREANAYLENRASAEATKLTEDGTEEHPYRGPVVWSPDSRSFVIQSVREVKRRRITLVESSPEDQLQPKIRTIIYQKPGDELPQPQPVLVHVADRKPHRIAADLCPTPFEPEGTISIRWSPRSDEFYFDYNQRGHQLYRIIAVNAATAAARVVVEEKANTFIDYQTKTWRQWLDKTGELLWMSERDGWAHLWLYDVATGAVKTQITSGQWVVRGVQKVDEEKREIWLIASGLNAGEDPYQRHLCRVRFDGGGFTQLTPGDGDHTVTFSPDQKYFVDTWSRADLAPIVELHRSDTGALVCELERGDASALLATGWTMPERFVAKGRDGTTDIYGVLFKPSNFDPAQKYPVLEEVYAGPHDSFAPKSFVRATRQHALAELGFIVVQADGMGTNNRGKAFHDVAWKNLADAGFPDRIAWIKAAAVTRPWMDLSRVGIYGGSAGGQNAMRALLDHHDFYRAAFADCGCHDNRMDKIWWNEQWLGWPVDESYVRSSNVADAAKLQGRLMLCVGELDTNVDPSATMQVVNALQKAGKDFDLLVMAGSGHGAAESPFGRRRRMDFFVRQLLGVEPPAWP
jgi:dipeptidyl aminopeptidase/acylaminoacyl peptidase